MFNKTSSLDFLEFGEVFNEGPELKNYHEGNHLLPIQNRDVMSFYCANEDIYLRCIEGICLLVVLTDLNTCDFHDFVVHRVVKLNKGIYFNFISLTNKASIELALTDTTVLKTFFAKQEYRYKHLKPTTHVNELIAYYYNVRGSFYSFPGEMNQFWELTYVDSGTLYDTIDNIEYEVSKNQCIIAPPNTMHKQRTTESGCSYLTIVVDLKISDEDAKRLSHTVFTVDRSTKRMIDNFVSVDNQASHYNRDLLITSIESIFLLLLKSTEDETKRIASTPMQQKFENELLDQIILYINENIYSSFNVEDLCDNFAISRSSLQSLFKNNLNIAPKEYISNLKLKKSQELIKESKYTISEIATILGFSSIHYFSRRFKQEFGVNPTDYANTLL